ncbi:flagellar biosynthetic protein FliR [Tropicimonas sp. S265A]|uniref:flagellar biosynthetic protein FliR n=1 Tax=Tropicimonas sp. S265A TaxID=3415134 RepID=UPI003C7B7CAA
MNEFLAYLSSVAIQSTFLQVSGFLLLAPIYGERMLSVRIKVVCLILFSFILFPSRAETILELRCQSVESNVILIQSLISGLQLGVLLRASVFILQVFGAFLSQLSSLSQILGPSVAGDMSPAVGQLVLFAGLFILASIDVHIDFVAALQNTPLICSSEESYAQILLTSVLDVGGTVVRVAVILAMPFVALNILYNAFLGFMNRAMPQLMVAFVGAPLLVGGFLLTLVIFLPLALGAWIAQLHELRGW